jgi:Carbohydrate binding domain 30
MRYSKASREPAGSQLSWQACTRRVTALACLLVVAFMGHTAALAQPSPPPLVIWNFDKALTNTLGGHYNVFMRDPSSARSFLDPSFHLFFSGHSLRVTVHREAEGFCGVWFDFYPASDVSQKYLDARAYRYLSFWVKGEKGGEDFDITLKDDSSSRHPDTNPTVSLHSYLPGGASTNWQEVLIPLGDFNGLDARRLLNLSFLIAEPGDERFYVDNIAFKADSSEAPAPAEASAGAAPAPSGKNWRGLWVWKTVSLLDPAHPERADRFFEFCTRQGVLEIFLSLDLHQHAEDGQPHFDLKNPERYQGFLKRAHSMGLQVDALAGTPEWAVRQKHAEALAVLDTVIAFNRASPADARFDGVHFDVEPYSLIGYADPAYRPRLLEEYLEMVAKCVARVHTMPGLRFGCDVPSWFYPGDSSTRRELTVNFRGTAKSVGEHLTDLLDAVTIMDYRNEADGAGGIIMMGTPSLEYAASQGKKIQVGLETSIEPDRTVYFACGLPLKEFQKSLGTSDLHDKLYFGEYRLATLFDGTNVHIGLTAPENLEGAARAEFERAVAHVALELGASSDPKRFPADPILGKARLAVGRDPEWVGFEVFNFSDPQTQRPITGFFTVRHMSPKITFHGLSREIFNEETRSVTEWLSPFRSFQGLAIHYYQSYRELEEGK